MGPLPIVAESHKSSNSVARSEREDTVRQDSRGAALHPITLACGMEGVTVKHYLH
jgi:hypothetical protein